MAAGAARGASGERERTLQPLRRGCAETLELRRVSRSLHVRGADSARLLQDLFAEMECRTECEVERRAKEKASRDVDRRDAGEEDRQSVKEHV
jgi:hypothetical protein